MAEPQRQIYSPLHWLTHSTDSPTGQRTKETPDQECSAASISAVKGRSVFPPSVWSTWPSSGALCCSSPRDASVKWLEMKMATFQLGYLSEGPVWIWMLMRNWPISKRRGVRDTGNVQTRSRPYGDALSILHWQTTKHSPTCANTHIHIQTHTQMRSHIHTLNIINCPF